MVHTRYSLGRRIVALIIAMGIFISIPLSSYAISKGSYSGKYDLFAAHTVNKQYNPYTGEYDEERCNANMQACYQQFLSWGLTKEAAAGIVGNFLCEGCGGTDTTENWTDWDNFVFGTTGFGLMGFTWYELQAVVFDFAYEDGVQWTDLKPQLQAIKQWYLPQFEDMYYNSHDIDELTSHFCAKYERPGSNNFGDRIEKAKQALEKYKDLPPKDYDGSLSGYTSGETKSDGNNVSLTGEVLSEWDLTGMPVKSGLTANVLSLEHVSKADIAEADQRYGVALIKEDIESRGKINAWTKARQIVVFVGLILFSYALILLLAMLFDRVNTVIDVSLVGAITLGAVRLSKNQEEEGEQERVRYVTSKQLTIIIVIISLIAGVFVSGGVLPAVMKSVYAIMGK